VTHEQVLLFEDFETRPDGPLPADWWVEGGERVWVERGRLHVRADPAGAKGPGGVCTVWHRRAFEGDIRVEFDACVVGSGIDANNINLFLLYSDPSGRPLYDSRAARAGAGYDLYHGLNGYIFTFLNDAEAEGGRLDDGSTKARFRMRRCPGFRFVAEAFGYHCRKGVVYHVAVTRRGGRLTYAVDGTTFLSWDDDAPLDRGHIGLRTYRTHLWWDNIRVVRPG
jgi:hypothetical protein